MPDWRWLRSMRLAKRHDALLSPPKLSFALGFLTEGRSTGSRSDPASRDELPNIEITVSSQYSPTSRMLFVRGKLDVAFLRRKHGQPI